MSDSHTSNNVSKLNEYTIKFKELNEKKMSSFLKELYNLKKKCFFKNNKTYNKINDWINNRNDIQFTIFKLKHIIREYLNECNMKSIINIFKKIDSFNIYFKIFITNFFFSEASSVSIGCEKNSKLKQPREEGMEFNPVTENILKSRNKNRIFTQNNKINQIII